MPATAITAPFQLAFRYTVTGHVHRSDFYVPSLTLTDPVDGASSILASGASSGVSLDTVITDVVTALKARLPSDATIDTATLYKVIPGDTPTYVPLWSEPIGVSGTGAGTAVLGSSCRVVVKRVPVKGVAIFSELCETYPPTRLAPPVSTGTGLFDKVWKWFFTLNYFCLRDASFPTTVFHVSVQYNKKLLRIRGLR